MRQVRVSKVGELQMQDILDALTNAILDEQDHNLDDILGQFNVTYEQVSSLVTLIRGLRATLVAQQPSRKFIKHLKRDLLGQSERNLGRQVQIAAASLAAAAGVALLVHRWMVGEPGGIEAPLLPQ